MRSALLRLVARLDVGVGHGLAWTLDPQVLGHQDREQDDVDHGEQRHAILGELGYAAAEVARLEADGVV